MKNLILIVALAVCSCSGDDGPMNVDPKLITGGGVADGPLNGTLHVHVVEVDTATPIAGATVTVGATTLATDAAGLATFPDLTDPQTVSATAPGHAATTWIGVDGGNVTLPLDLTHRAIPTAKASGTIAGWNNLPAPALGKYTLGLVLYSFLDDPSAPENAIAQPMNSGAPLNTCLNTGLQNSCAWQLNTRIGPQVHSAVIVEGDPKGTNNDISDDTYTLIGYAVGQPMTLTAGQQVSNESLAMLTTATTNLSVMFPGPPTGLGHVIAIPELALGDTGRLVFPLPQITAANPMAKVPSPTGALAGKYEIVALATPSPTATTPYSTAFVHDVMGSATIPAMLAAPPAPSGNKIAMSGAGNFHTAQLTRSGDTLWNVTVLDGSSMIALPSLTPDPLGSGSADTVVTGADAPGFNVKSFDIPAVKRAMMRAAGVKGTFAR